MKLKHFVLKDFAMKNRHTRLFEEDPPLYFLSGFAMNSYLLINGNSAVLIDVGFSPEEIIEYLQANDLELKAILLTHAHLDHIGGIDEVREVFDVPLFLHQLEKSWLSDPVLNGSEFLPHFGKVTCKPTTIELLSGDTVLEIDDFSFTVIHTPGHTPGGLCYLVNSWLFTGDSLFNRSIGRTDMLGGDSKSLLKSIKDKLFSLPNRVNVYPGHGEKTTIGEEKRLNPFVK